MKNVKSIFRSVEEKLNSLSWFNDDWEIYNRGDYLQLAKVNWYNGNQGGVHFETYIEASQIKEKLFLFLCMQKKTARRRENLFKNSLSLKVNVLKAGKDIRL